MCDQLGRVQLRDVPDPELVHPGDVVVRFAMLAAQEDGIVKPVVRVSDA